MLVDQVFEAWLYSDPLTALNDKNYPYAEGINITEGILNVNITSGTDIYEGPQQQIDSGQFTIVTRNPALDPKINANLKYNSTIKFYDPRGGEFFRGYVTDVQVEYQREDNPIITITGTDIFGAMQRVVIDQDTHDAIMALSTGPTWNGLTFSEFIPYMLDFTEKYLDVNSFQPGAQSYGFWFTGSDSFAEQPLGQLAYSPAKYIPQVGETYLEILNKYAQTNLSSFKAKSEFGYDYIEVTPFVKFDPDFWAPQEDPIVIYTNYDFSSNPANDKSYQSILLDNGYNRVINQIDISNEYRNVVAGELESTTESFTRTSAESIEDYAISKASISTIFPLDNPLPNPTWATRHSESIFQVVQFPGQEIQQITFDNARAQMIEDNFTYSDYQINQIVRIKHQINNSETIDRIYDIAGINHDISPDNWSMTFTLKPSKQELAHIYQGAYPTLEMNATSGSTTFSFTATLVDFDPETIFNVYWVLSAVDANEIRAMYPYARTGNMFKDGEPRTGFTQTWDFDDDGILAPYSFDGDSTFDNPLDNRFGGYGPGNWNVYAYIWLTNGYFVVLQQPLVVGTPVVEADFGWTQNLTNNFGQVFFTDTSVNHETGEPDSYLWDFGDGTTSTERNPVKVYDPDPGETTYTVSLTVFAYGPGNTKVYDTHTETVTLVQPTMTADFTWTANYQTVTFTNTSTNVGFEEPDAYLWDFGDGTTSTEKNPVHVFPVTDINTPQSFSVTLTTRNIWEQTDSNTQTVTTTALNKTGTYPVRYIKLRIDPYTNPGTTPLSFAITPQFYQLKARTSNTLENLTNSAQLVNFTDNYIPTVQFVTVSGGSPQESLGMGGYLTRQSSNTLAMGCGSFSSQPFSPVKTVRMELVLEIPTAGQHLINDIIMKATTLFKDGVLRPSSFYPKIYVDVATTIGGYTPNPAGTYGPPTLNGDWVNIGYFKFTGGNVATADYTMTALRPLPMNIPYFLYTFNDKTASFTSVETADSYAWTFGDGTTSTLKDPVKTYAAYGTYNVTLAVTNGGVVTRTTTEPVIVEPPVL